MQTICSSLNKKSNWNPPSWQRNVVEWCCIWSRACSPNFTPCCIPILQQLTPICMAAVPVHGWLVLQILHHTSLHTCEIVRIAREKSVSCIYLTSCICTKTQNDPLCKNWILPKWSVLPRKPEYTICCPMWSTLEHECIKLDGVQSQYKEHSVRLSISLLTHGTLRTTCSAVNTFFKLAA